MRTFSDARECDEMLLTKRRTKKLSEILMKETVHQLWWGEKMCEVQQIHIMSQGFMQSSVFQKCYLPRQTQDEMTQIDGREFIVKNYCNRNQEIGK